MTDKRRAFLQRHPERQIVPIRKVLTDLISKGTAWRWSDVWGLTGGLYSPAGVKKYLTVLVGLGVVVVDQHHVMRGGPNSATWMAEQPTTRPGGNAYRYRVAHEARQNLAKAPHQRSAPRPEIPRDLQDPLFTISEVAKILGTGVPAVTALVSSGEIRAFSIGKCSHRIFQTELCRYIRAKREAMRGS